MYVFSNQTMKVLPLLGKEVIVNRGAEEIGVDPDKLWADAVASEEALNRKDAQEALDLHQGDLLEGFYLPGAAPAFSQWLGALSLGTYLFYIGGPYWSFVILGWGGWGLLALWTRGDDLLQGVLREALRMMRGRVLVAESVVEEGKSHRLLTALDAGANRLRSRGAMREQKAQFRTAAAWKQVAERLGASVVDEKRRGRWVHRQAFFALEKKK